MSARSMRVRRRLQGVAFLAVIAALLSLVIAKYNGTFTAGTLVTLQADTVGNQLQERSDVKVRGLIVGEVEEVTSSGDIATVTMRMQPDALALIPQNVTARLLPKTLFGEKFVSLVIPPQPSTERLAAGDVITQDRSQAARELEEALDGLLPLLEAVEPQDVAATLGALSQALEGRGEQLGENLVMQQQLVSGLNTELPALQEDLVRIAEFSDTYAEAAPDLVNALDDLSTTTRTVAEQRVALSTLFGSVTAASTDLRTFLEANQENLVGLAASSRPTLESLARYAPEFPCLLGQLTGLIPQIDEATGVGTPNPGVRITLEVTNNRGPYVPGEQPRYEDDRGPRCYPVIDGQNFPQYPPDGPFRDGSNTPMPPGGPSPEDFGDAEDFTPAPTGTQAAGTSNGATSNGATSNGATSSGLPNSPEEQRTIAEVLAASRGVAPSEVAGWSSLLVGPLLRGSEVELR